MAGIGLIGTELHFGPTAALVQMTHLTQLSVQVAGGEITQVVADQVAPLAMAQAPVKSVQFGFALPKSGAATLLAAYKELVLGEVQILVKDGIGGTTLLTWDSVDDQSQSQGVTVTFNGNQFVLGTGTISTNGGAWT